MVTRATKKATGRPPKGSPEAGKTANFNARITPALRERLNAAAKATGLTLTDEVENRLWRAFRLDDELAAIFKSLGGRRTLALFQLFARLENWLGVFEEREWLDDPAFYEKMCAGMISLLDKLRPTEKPKPAHETMASRLLLPDGAAAAESVIRTLLSDERMSDIREALGESIMKRLKP